MKPIFSRSQHIDDMAFLNWRMSFNPESNLRELGEGYLTSSLYLIEKCLNDNEDKKADIVIFPILNCLNHGIELFIKSLIFTINAKSNDEFKLEGTHNLKQLLNTLRARIKESIGEKGMNSFDLIFIPLTAYIDELFEKTGCTEKDSKMDFSRYPFDKKLENHFYVNNINCEIDLENLRDRVEKIFNLFDQYSDFIIYGQFSLK